MQEIGRCGWEPPPGSAPRHWVVQTPQGPRPATARLMRGAEEGDLAVAHLGDWTPPAPGELFERFLDLPLTVRLILDGARRLLGAQWLLLITGSSIELYRLPDETRELRVGSGWETERTLLPALSALARHPGGAAPAPASHLDGARALGEWLRHWTVQLASALEAPAEPIERMIWKWIVMLQVARRGAHGWDREQWGIRLEALGEVWELDYDPLSTVAQMSGNIERFDQFFSTRLFDGETARQCEWIERLEETSLLEQLRAELLMHGQYRFEAETAAWMFTSLEREQAGWRREMTGVEPVHRRLKHEGWNVFEPMTVNIGSFGLTAALRDAERLAQYWSEFDRYIERRQSRDAEAIWGQPDFFCRSPRGVDERGRLEDGLNFMFSESLRLGGFDPEKRFGAGVTFLLKAVALAQAMNWPLRGLDTLDAMLRK